MPFRVATELWRGEFEGPVVKTLGHVIEPPLVPGKKIPCRRHIGAPVAVAVPDHDTAGQGTGDGQETDVRATHLHDVEEEVASFCRARRAEPTWSAGSRERLHDEQPASPQGCEAVEGPCSGAADVQEELPIGLRENDPVFRLVRVDSRGGKARAEAELVVLYSEGVAAERQVLDGCQLAPYAGYARVHRTLLSTRSPWWDGTQAWKPVGEPAGGRTGVGFSGPASASVATAQGP